MKTLRFITALFAIFVAASAAAQDGTIVRRTDMGWSATGRKSNVTLATTNLYVATTGNDSSTCTSVSTPCLTIQGAVNKVPKTIAHPVTITVGAGSFTGMTISGFSIGWNGSTIAPYLLIQGTLTTATVTGGTATGTVSSATALSGSTHATMTDSGQSWTVNEHAGKLLEIVTGTGSGETAFHIIVSNTSTVLTLAGAWQVATPNNASTYAIRDWATIIDTAQTPPASNSLWSESLSSAGINVTANLIANSETANGFLAVSKLKVTTSQGLRQDGYGPMVARWCNLNTVRVVHGAQLGLFNSYVSPSTSTTTITAGNKLGFATSGMRIVNTFVNGGSNGVVAGGMPVEINNSVIANATSTAFGTGGSGPIHTIFTNARIDCGSLGGDGIQTFGTTTLGPAPFTMRLAATNISNCATAIEFDHPYASAQGSTLAGTGNTTAINLSKGGKLQLGATSTLTGTSEIVLDGAAAVTIASMRAASPKLLTNTYGTIIYE